MGGSFGALPGRHFPIWRSVTLGTEKSTQELIDVMMASKRNMDIGAFDLLMKTPVSSIEYEIDLVAPYLYELGYKKEDQPLYRDVYERVLTLGYRQCPAEVGPKLRRQYHNQPENESLLILMEAMPLDTLPGLHGIYKLSSLGRHNPIPELEGLWLSAHLQLDVPSSLELTDRIVCVQPV